MSKAKGKKIVVQVTSNIMQDSESDEDSGLPELNPPAKKKNVVQQKKNITKVANKQESSEE